jgi:hypothetical protein
MKLYYLRAWKTATRSKIWLVTSTGDRRRAYWFPEFRPSRHLSPQILFDLLDLFNMQVCCNLTGSFPTFLEQLQESYRLIILYMEIEDIPIIRLLLQHEEDPIEHFSFGAFEFHLEHTSHDDVCRYRAFQGDYSFPLLVSGVDTLKSCGPFGKVEFVNLWDNVNHFGFPRHSIKVLPPIFPNCHTRLLNLHYMAAASGLDYASRCVDCRY